jgi:hypothetical protein
MMRQLMAATAATLALGALVGCASDEPGPKPPPGPAATHAAPPPVSTAAPPPVSPPALPKDACGADEAQRLVGRPRSEVPIPMRPALQRVACTTCPVTMDYNPRRLNFFYEASSGIIKEVKCG